jgi:RNase P subunit RPR2
MTNKGFCMKCKAERTMDNTERVTMKSNRLAGKGTCATCGSTMFSW